MRSQAVETAVVATSPRKVLHTPLCQRRVNPCILHCGDALLPPLLALVDLLHHVTCCRQDCDQVLWSSCTLSWCCHPASDKSLRLPGKSLPATPRSLSSPERTGQDHHLDDRGTRRHTAANEGREGARAATQEERLRRNQRLPASHLPPLTWATRHSSTAFAKLATRALIPRCGIHGSSQVLHEAWRRVNLAIYFVFQTL